MASPEAHLTPEERTLVLLIGEALDPQIQRGRVVHRRWLGYGNSYARCGQNGQIIVANFDSMTTCRRCLKLIQSRSEANHVNRG